MGMHTEEWLKNDKEQCNAYNVTLDKNRYELDLIKVQFGEEYIPIPQTIRLTGVISGFGNRSLEGGLLAGVRDELLQMDAFKDRIGSDGTVTPIPGDEEKFIKAMEQLIFEKGPYYVINKAYTAEYNMDMEYFISKGEAPYDCAVTEEELKKLNEKIPDEMAE